MPITLLRQSSPGDLERIANDLREMLGGGDYDRIVDVHVGTSFRRANDLVQRVITQVKIDPSLLQCFREVSKSA